MDLRFEVVVLPVADDEVADAAGAAACCYGAVIGDAGKDKVRASANRVIYLGYGGASRVGGTERCSVNGRRAHGAGSDRNSEYVGPCARCSTAADKKATGAVR